MESQKSPIMLVFPSAEAADRRVAGVAAAARLVRGLGQQGKGRVTIALSSGATLTAATWRDLERVAAGVAVDLVADREMPSSRDSSDGDEIVEAPRLDTLKILAATGKASDGPVSRWINRPVSRRISRALLRLSWIRPIHATCGTVAITAAMFLAFLLGGPAGAVAGGLLFQAASVFDGVDGEIARATWRTSAAGARLDTLVDAATNFLFVLGLTLNLAERHDQALPVGLWGLLLFAVGLLPLGAQAARATGNYSFDLLKHDRGRPAGPVIGRLMTFLTVVSSRDFFALLFAALILVGQPMLPLWIFAIAATIWLPLVVRSTVRLRRAEPARRSA